MPETEHDQIRSMAESVSGRTLPGRTTSTLLDILERNMGESTTEATGNNYTIQNPDLDTLAIDTSDGPVTVTLGEGFFVNGAHISITDISANAATNNITIQTHDSTPINGQDPLIIDVDSGAVTLEYLSGGLLSGGAKLDIVTTVGSIL